MRTVLSSAAPEPSHEGSRIVCRPSWKVFLVMTWPLSREGAERAYDNMTKLPRDGRFLDSIDTNLPRHTNTLHSRDSGLVDLKRWRRHGFHILCTETVSRFGRACWYVLITHVGIKSLLWSHHHRPKTRHVSKRRPLAKSRLRFVLSHKTGRSSH